MASKYHTVGGSSWQPERFLVAWLLFMTGLGFMLKLMSQLDR